MTEQSSYLKYLPLALWSQENDPQQFLGEMLRIFEKILTGIPDGVVIGEGSPYGGERAWLVRPDGYLADSAPLSSAAALRPPFAV